MLTPLEDARAVLQRARDVHGVRRVAVGVSGGKDSIVTLDLCVEAFGRENVRAFYMWMVPGIRSVEQPAEVAAARAGVELIKVPHWHVSVLLRNSVLMPPRPGATSVKLQKLGDVERRVRELTGFEWISYGWRATDSLTRRIMFKRWGDVWPGSSPRVFPIARWKDADVIGYLRARRIPVPPRFGSRTEGGPSGFDLSVRTLRYLREWHPDDYATVLKHHPFAEATLVHADMHGEKK